MATVAAMLAALLVTSAWVFYADDRLPSHSARIGTLTIDLPEGSGSGTAFLVDECSVLTNFHVAFGPWYVTALRPPSYDFKATFTLTEVTLPDGTHPTARATPVVWGDYLGPDRQLRRPGEDWAYLALDRCLGADYGYFDLREADFYEPPVDQGFTAIGYSSGRQMADPHCAARPESDPDRDAGGQGWLHDCATLAGDSGGPMFHTGTLTVVALASAYRAGQGQHPCRAAKPGVVGDLLSSWGNGCANIAVPVTTAMRERILYASAAVGVQALLAQQGFEVGPFGAIESPELQAAIAQAERDIGWKLTAAPPYHFYTLKWLRSVVR